MMRDLKKMVARMFRAQRPLIAAALLLTLLQCVMELHLPRLMAEAVDGGLMYGDVRLLEQIGGRMLILAVAMGAAGYGASIFCLMAGERLALGLRGELYEKIHSLSVRQVSAMGHGALITRLTVDAEVCAGLVQAMVLFLAEPFFLMAGGVVMMWLISWQLGLVFVGFVAAQLVCMLFFIRLTAADYARARAMTDALNSRLQDALAHFRMSKAYGADAAEKTRFNRSAAELLDASYRVQRKAAVFNPLIMLIMNMSVAAVLLLSGLLVPDGGMKVGTVLSAITYCEQVLLAIAASGRVYRVILEAQPSAARIFELLEAAPELKEGGEDLDEPFRELRFEAVDFSFPEGGSVLRGISFLLRAGETLAVVGPVGSGKTTLAGLCLRLCDPTGGRVLINRRSARDLSQKTLRRITALSEKQSVVLEGTVEENIVFGREGITEVDIERAVAAAQLKEYIEKCPMGLQTELSSMGVSLSGGEKQRLTIARALAGRPGLLVLDDSTSCLDYETERRLLAAIRETYPETAVLLIGNRSAGAATADRILVLEDGRLSAQGSDRELRACSPFYRRLCAAQDS